MTMKEVAKLAGVSVATVSHVINGTKHITKETKDRVLQAIQQVNYTPNPMARSLRQGKTNLIGILAEDIRCGPSAEILGGISSYLRGSECQPLFIDLQLRDPLQEHYEQIGLYRDTIDEGIATLLRANVDGILYIAMHDRHLDGMLDVTGKPLVFAHSHGNGTNFVSYDSQEGARMITQRLLAHGHRDIAVIGGHAQSYPTMQRLSGFQLAMQDAGLEIPKGYIRNGDWTLASGEREARALLALKRPPTAIFAMNDFMAAGCMRAVQAMGVQVPSELSITGFDNQPLGAYLSPALSSVALPGFAIGEESAQMLLFFIEDASAPGYFRTLPCQIIERGSVAPIAGAKDASVRDG